MDDSFSDFFHAMSGVTSQADKSQNSKNQMENMIHSSMPLGQQQFYPTPNSANMHTIQSEKQFMSPFPAVQQSYNNMSSDGTFAELDEVKAYRTYSLTIVVVHSNAFASNDPGTAISTTRPRLGAL